MPNYNLVATVNQLGYGVVGSGLLRGLSELGYEVALWPLGPCESGQEDAVLINKAIGRAAFYDADAPCLRLYHPFDMALFAGRGPRLGYTFFETTTLRSMEFHQLRSLDKVFVPSRWARDILERNGIPASSILVAPPGVDTRVFDSRLTKTVAPHKSTTILNVGKWEYRKGHDFVLKAFERAFREDDDVHLIMACYNPLKVPGFDGPAVSEQFARLYRSSSLASKMTIIDGRLRTQQEVASLMAAADIGFFPSRAEGWNLPAAEMAAMGKQLVLTDYSAHTEFAHDACACLIDIDSYEKAYDGAFFHGDVGEWAHLGEKQLTQAADILRDLHERKQTGNLLPLSTQSFVTKYTWKNTARYVVS